MRTIQVSRTVAAALLIGGGATSAIGAPWKILGTVSLQSGVESNPYLNSSASAATGVFSLSGNVTASRETARSTTNVLASAQVGQYVSRYGRNSNFLIGASRTQSLTERLTLGGGATYTNTLNPQSNFGFAPNVDTATIDYLTLGTRTERIDGYLNADWRATDKDVFRGGITGSRSTYAGGRANANAQYGANFSYLRTIDARTSLGVQLGATQITSSGFPSSQSYQANLLIVRRISAYWQFDGGIGLIGQHTNGIGAATRATLGFNGSLCGTYPRSLVCFTFSRQSAPSGIGGLRTDTQLGLNAQHSLTERSRISATLAYNLSSSRYLVTIPRQRYYNASLSYNHDVAPRISVGAIGRYQRRVTDSVSPLFPAGALQSYSINGTVTYSFGHRGS